MLVQLGTGLQTGASFCLGLQTETYLLLDPNINLQLMKKYCKCKGVTIDITERCFWFWSLCVQMGGFLQYTPIHVRSSLKTQRNMFSNWGHFGTSSIPVLSLVFIYFLIIVPDGYDNISFIYLETQWVCQRSLQQSTQLYSISHQSETWTTALENIRFFFKKNSQRNKPSRNKHDRGTTRNDTAFDQTEW